MGLGSEEYLQPLGRSYGDWSESRNSVGAGDGGGSLIMTDDKINCSNDDGEVVDRGSTWGLGLADMRQDELVENVDERVSE